MNKLDTVRINGEDYEISCSYNNLTDKPDIPATAADIGLGNVVNTGDSATPVEGGTTKFTTGGAYTELAKKADTEGYYKNLHVGVADNLFGEAYTDDVFTLRTTAGNQDIASGDMPYGDGKVSKIEGNTVVWNQLMYDEVKEQSATCSGTSQMIRTTVSGKLYTIIQNHVYYISALFKTLTDSDRTLFNGGLAYRLGNLTDYTRVSYLRTATASETDDDVVVLQSNINNDSSVSGEFGYKNLVMIDLTLLGIDNLTTTDEVEQWLADNVGAKEYYEYNPGELIPVKDYSIKSTGFNLWDEQWEKGYWNVNTGVAVGSEEYMRCKNFIEVFPSIDYCLSVQYAENGTNAVIFFDEGGNHISYELVNKNALFTTPQNCHKIKFYTHLSYGNTYRNDICINLSYRSDRDGEYEEHWEHTMPVDITKLTGRLNGTGEDVVVFPDGLKKAGTVRDEIVRSGDNVKAIKRIGSVALKDLEYTPSGASYEGFTHKLAVLSSMKDSTPNSKSNFGVTCVGWSMGGNNGIGTFLENGVSKIGARINTTELGSQTFNEYFEAHNSVFYYELATPEEYILDDEVLPIQYRVDDYGIEEVLLDNEEEVTSCSPKMTINYGLNAAKTIGDLPHEYISIHKQAIDEGHQAQARHNINAASQDDFIRVQEQLDAINPKVDNDVYVDLGLPSGLLWAKRNIDVTQPDGFASSEYTYDASFFSWGNTEGHNPTGTTFDYSFDAENYASTPGSKLTGNIGLSYDAARVNLGAPWRMPTKEDFQELLDNCDFVDANGNVIPSTTQNKMITINSTNGIRLKSKNNGKILFLSACGYANGSNKSGNFNGCFYTSSYLNIVHAYYLYVLEASITVAYSSKFYGYCIRPVM